MKLALLYSYDGSTFQGSQSQSNGKSVEDALNLALTHLGIYEKVKSSSRTDAKVHALNQLSTVNSSYEFQDLDFLKKQINRHLSKAIFLKKIFKVAEDFNVRFDAKARSYRYIIKHGNFSPFLNSYCLFHERLNFELLQKNIKIFEGEHDFTNFMKTGSDTKSPIRRIFQAQAYEYKDLTILTFKANGFLRSQLRLIIANLLKADKNNLELEKEFQLQALTRIPASPNGLYLNRIFY